MGEQGMKKIGSCFVVSLLLLGIFSLFPQRATAIGDVTIVQINGAGQLPGFTPALLTIHMYDTVVFVNRAPTPYAVTAADTSFSSPAIPAGQQWHVTFGSVGAHEYHTTESPQRMSGEILVVANSVSLLPTPVPQVEATALAIIKAGKHPPDVIVLPATPTPALTRKAHTTDVPFAPPLLFIGGGVLLLLVVLLLIFGIYALYRRHQKRVHEEEEMENLLEEIAPVPTAHKPRVEVTQKAKRRPLLAGLRRQRSHHSDEDDEDDDE